MKQCSPFKALRCIFSPIAHQFVYTVQCMTTAVAETATGSAASAVHRGHASQLTSYRETWLNCSRLAPFRCDSTFAGHFTILPTVHFFHFCAQRLSQKFYGRITPIKSHCSVRFALLTCPFHAVQISASFSNFAPFLPQ